MIVLRPWLYISLAGSCHIHLWCQLSIIFPSVNKGGNYMLFLGLNVPGEVPRCSASTLALLVGFLNSGWKKVCSMVISLIENIRNDFCFSLKKLVRRVLSY